MNRLFSFLMALILSAPAWAAPPADYELEAAARTFRISTYQTYRTNRVEYDRRIATCTEAVKRFYQASDNQGREQIRQWFAEATSGHKDGFPELPQIELAKSLPSREPSRGQKIRSERQNGFRITKYEDNPRFKSDFRSRENTNLVSGDKSRGNGVSNLFSKIGKSFLSSSQQDAPNPNDGQTELGGSSKSDNPSAADETETESEVKDYQDVDDPFAPVQAEAVQSESTLFPASDVGVDESRTGASEVNTESVTAEAEVNSEADVEKSSDDSTEATVPQDTSADFDLQSLNKRILNFNLTIEMFYEDLTSDSQKTVDGLDHLVEQLEAADATFHAISAAQLPLTPEQQEQLTKIASLEDLATEVMTSINELIARQGVDAEEGAAEDNAHVRLEDLRKRVSKVLANHAL